MKPCPTSALLTIPETAAELRVDENTVYRRIADGDLRAVDIAPEGSRQPKTRVRRDDLTAYIDKRTRTITPAAS